MLSHEQSIQDNHPNADVFKDDSCTFSKKLKDSSKKEVLVLGTSGRPKVPIARTFRIRINLMYLNQ